MKNIHKKSVLRKLPKEALKTTFDFAGSKILGRYWEIKNFIGTCYGAIKELNFDKFIEALYSQFKSKNVAEKDIKNYIEKLQKGNGIQYISNIIDSLYFSKCSLASQILGLITAKYLSEDDLDYCDLYLVTALKDLYDSDIRMFVKFYMNNANTEDNAIILNEYTEQERVILDKLQNLNIFARDITLGRLGDGEHKPILYEKTEVSIRLFNYYTTFVPTDDSQYAVGIQVK